MYTPSAFAVTSQPEILGALRRIAFGHMVSVGGAGGYRFESTPLPFVVDDGLTELRGHLARANAHWEHIDGCEALMIVAGPDAYVSPRWYASKAEHGKVVPTWNYEVIHVHGTVEIHHEPSWTREVVADLTDQNERRVDDPQRGENWAVSDAPAGFIDAQLTAIVGVGLRITAIEAKHKLSQNRSAADRRGAIAGLGRSSRPSDLEVFDLMGSTDTA